MSNNISQVRLCLGIDPNPEQASFENFKMCVERHATSKLTDDAMAAQLPSSSSEQNREHTKARGASPRAPDISVGVAATGQP